MTVTLNSYPVSQVFGCYRNSGATYYDVDGILQDASANALLVSYDGSKNYRGMTCRQQGTNLHGNPRCLGAVAGSPGTDPTGMTLSFTDGTCTKSIIGSGIDSSNGMDYVDVQIAGLPTGAGPYLLYLDAATEPCLASTPYTHSIGYKLMSGSMSGINNIQVGLQTYTSGGTLIATYSLTGSQLNPTSALQRQFITITSDATAAFLRPLLRLQFVSSGWTAVSVVLRFYLPQVEKGSAFSTTMRPAAGTLGSFTRGADNILESLQTGALNATTNTVLAECYIAQAALSGQDQGIWRFDDGTDSNKFVLLNVAGGLDVQAQLTIGGTLVATADLGSFVAGSTFRAMAGYDFTTGKIAGLISGGNRATASFTPPGSPPVFTRSLPGRSSLNAGDPTAQSARHLNGHIGRSYLCGPPSGGGTGVLDEQSMLYLSQMNEGLGALLTAAGVVLAGS